MLRPIWFLRLRAWVLLQIHPHGILLFSAADRCKHCGVTNFKKCQHAGSDRTGRRAVLRASRQNSLSTVWFQVWEEKDQKWGVVCMGGSIVGRGGKKEKRWWRLCRIVESAVGIKRRKLTCDWIHAVIFSQTWNLRCLTFISEEHDLKLNKYYPQLNGCVLHKSQVKWSSLCQLGFLIWRC